MEVIFYFIGLVGFLVFLACRARNADHARGEDDAKPGEAHEDGSKSLGIAAIVPGIIAS
jgi:hypothetical protein